MTREEAIAYGKECLSWNEFSKNMKMYQFIEMAIQALSQEPCSNCCNGNQIEKAKLCQKSYLAGMEHKQEPTDTWSIKDVADAFERHGLMKEQEPCDDAVSREAVIEWLENATYEDISYAVGTELSFLPSVTQKSGKWINDENHIPICNKCGYIPPYDRAIDDYEYSNFCPNCGAKMVEPQERSDKE